MEGCLFALIMICYFICWFPKTEGTIFQAFVSGIYVAAIDIYCDFFVSKWLEILL